MTSVAPRAPFGRVAPPGGARAAARALRAGLHGALRWYSIPVTLAAWELLARSGFVSPRLVPDIATIAAALWASLASGDAWYHSSFTLERTAIAFGAAVPAGIVLGAVFARLRLFEALLEPIFAFGYPVPKITLFPIFVLVFGIGGMSKISLAFLEALYPITIGTYYGMKSAERIHLWSARSMGAGPGRIFWRILLPSALPYVFSSLRIGIHVALIVVVILEMIGDSVGLGYFVAYAAASYEYATSFAGIALIVIWGFLLDRLTILLRRRLVFWQRDAAELR
jgi:ABC-type nitrate/sulfonate/bicarbonate transport system permease component